MSKSSAQINKLINLLAEQLRFAERYNGTFGTGPEKAEACQVASKIVAQLELLGITFKESFIRAEEINEALSSNQSDKMAALELIESNL